MISIDVGAVLNEVRALSPFRQTVPSSDVDAAFLRAGSPHKANGWGRWAGVLVRTDEGTNALYHGTQFQRLWVISDTDQANHRIFSQSEAQGVANRLAADLLIQLGNGNQWRTHGRVVSFQQPTPAAQQPAPQTQQPTQQPTAPPQTYPQQTIAQQAQRSAPPRPTPARQQTQAPVDVYMPPPPAGTPAWVYYAGGATLVAAIAAWVLTDD